jgi:hypothetical protein
MKMILIAVRGLELLDLLEPREWFVARATPGIKVGDRARAVAAEGMRFTGAPEGWMAGLGSDR